MLPALSVERRANCGLPVEEGVISVPSPIFGIILYHFERLIPLRTVPIHLAFQFHLPPARPPLHVGWPRTTNLVVVKTPMNWRQSCSARWQGGRRLRRDRGLSSARW